MSKKPSNRQSNPQVTVAVLTLLGVVITAFFGYLTVIRPQELSIEATRTAEAGQASATALTSTPSAASTLTPMPKPQVKISKPIDGQNAPTNPEVVVEYNNLPTDRYFWVAVRIPKVRPTGLIYPQLKEMKLPPHLVGTGIYHTYAALGGKEDTGVPFNIVVLLADQYAQDQISVYAMKCSSNADLCTGMPLPETGVEILDFITVIRQ